MLLEGKTTCQGGLDYDENDSEFDPDDIDHDEKIFEMVNDLICILSKEYKDNLGNL